MNAKSVLANVRVIDVKHVKLYSLAVNGETICEVTAETVPWLPKPTLNKEWLRGVVSLALRRYFTRSPNLSTSEVVRS